MKTREVEVPTLLVAALVHAGWLALTWWHEALPTWALVMGGAWLVAWHGSLQHETIHGHPTSRPWLNALIGGIPLSLWLPYGIYRRTHLAHHRTPVITEPLDDPESRYLSGRAGYGLTLLSRLEAPLLGRMLFGPPITVGRFGASEAVCALRYPPAVGRGWLPHLAWVAAVLLWLRICDFGVGHYALSCVYPGIALTLLRSFAEHRVNPQPGHRAAIGTPCSPAMAAW